MAQFNRLWGVRRRHVLENIKRRNAYDIGLGILFLGLVNCSNNQLEFIERVEMGAGMCRLMVLSTLVKNICPGKLWNC